MFALLLLFPVVCFSLMSRVLCSSPMASPSLVPRGVQTRVAMRSAGGKKEIYLFSFVFPKALGLSVCGVGVFLGWNS